MGEQKLWLYSAEHAVGFSFLFIITTISCSSIGSIRRERIVTQHFAPRSIAEHY